MSDKQFREWIQRQPSCISGRFSEYVDGEGRCIAAHVRRAGKSGIAYKAEYSCIPLTREEHDYQHQYGEFACLMRFKPFNSLALITNVQQAKVWFDTQVDNFRREWRNITGKQ